MVKLVRIFEQNQTIAYIIGTETFFRAKNTIFGHFRACSIKDNIFSLLKLLQNHFVTLRGSFSKIHQKPAGGREIHANKAYKEASMVLNSPFYSSIAGEKQYAKF